jgi:hypothetical protein
MLCKLMDYVLIPELGFPIFCVKEELAGAKIYAYSDIVFQNLLICREPEWGLLPIQYAAIAALNGDKSSVNQQCKLYEESGNCFGKLGKKYVRFALILNNDELDEVIER